MKKKRLIAAVMAFVVKRKPRDSRVVLKSLSDEQKSPDVE